MYVVLDKENLCMDRRLKLGGGQAYEDSAD
jgi:hypothetical protein